MKTLTASVFHPGIGKMVRLEVMHCENEDATNVALFWNLLSSAIKVATNNPNASFKPYGYMMDEGGAEWAGLERHADRKNCSFQRAVNFILNKQSISSQESCKFPKARQIEFKPLASSMLHVDSPAMYDKAYGSMAKLINSKAIKRSYLKSWLDW